ncbi:phenazine biosynthesis protein phzf family [Rhizoctonia solani]|nr:phenazine biosynthesis protein phzf family [Rhizoctonia solani]
MTSRSRSFMQVDVFPSSKSLSGNPVAVVLDGEGVSTETMSKFAHWTNLSETTFVQPATDPRADYKLRIFTITRELPFAGHPTLGSCKAWLEAGGKPKKEGEIVQECGIGLVTIKFDPTTGRLSFAAPNFLREGDVSADDLRLMCDAMIIDTSEVLSSRWIDNGPGWVGLLLKSADAVLAVNTKNISKANNINWGIVGPYNKAQSRVQRFLKGEQVSSDPDPNDDGSPHFELRAFAPKEVAFIEDQVTGSLNAGVGKWLISTGLAPGSYVASQGTKLGREGRIHVSADNAFAQGGDVWVGGETRVCIKGEVIL